VRHPLDLMYPILIFLFDLLTMYGYRELLRLALAVLEMPTPIQKAQMTIRASQMFDNVQEWHVDENDASQIEQLQRQLPDFPARPSEPKLVAPSEMISHRKLKIPLNVYLLHNIARIQTPLSPFSYLEPGR
jgi:uncharacterized ferritin-like protein (DUF455 family)